MESYKLSLQWINKILDTPTIFERLSSQMFNTADTYQNGVLYKEDLKQFLNMQLGILGIKEQMPDCTNLPEIFKQIDKDDSQTISKQEFTDLLKDIFLEQRKILEEGVSKS
jgi:Ca2+-binding EF-hand superfamily protein